MLEALIKIRVSIFLNKSYNSYMNFISNIREQLNKLNDEIGTVPTIGLLEGFKQEVLDAAKFVEANNLAQIVLIFETRAQVNQVAMEFEYIVIDEQREKAFKYAQEYYKLREDKDTIEAVRSNIFKAPLFAAMMLRNGEVDAVIGGVKYDPGEIIKFNIRANGLVSSRAIASTVTVLNKGGKNTLITDAVFNENPTKENMLSMSRNAIEFANLISLGKKVVFPYEADDLIDRDKATHCVNELTKTKFLNSIAQSSVSIKDVEKLTQDNDILVFSSLSNSLAALTQIEASGEYDIYGPVWIGLNKPTNMISKSARKEEIYNMVVITALLAQLAAKRRI